MAIPFRQAGEPRRSKSPATRTIAPASKRQADLALVPGRRRAARFAIALTVLLSGVMMGAVFVHTRIAERQLEIDHLERSLRQAQEDFDVLRADRADLRSLTRLSAAALDLGMQPAAEGGFVGVDPMLLAVTIARTGEVPSSDEIVLGSTARLEPLDQFRLVKAVSSEGP